MTGGDVVWSSATKTDRGGGCTARWAGLAALQGCDVRSLRGGHAHDSGRRPVVGSMTPASLAFSGRALTGMSRPRKQPRNAAAVVRTRSPSALGRAALPISAGYSTWLCQGFSPRYEWAAHWGGFYANPDHLVAVRPLCHYRRFRSPTRSSRAQAQALNTFLSQSHRWKGRHARDFLDSSTDGRLARLLGGSP